uniref:Uncharacterized protein n=1 Tax=Odontella aurita TaxID=265563 RepID=A0A7S4JFQ6_9STRA|mmetsp:Transcript_45712/g.138914  ORF Transcript_45712/g.138914 Transcript_45712/m.138914 type:complete len:333 (+) Transcript_45712:70-1068(+)
MKRSTSMYPGASRSRKGESASSSANLYGLKSSGRRIQSEAALRRSRSSSGAVRSILLEARYSNSSMASMNGGGSTTDLARGMSRPKKKASVKFTAPTIHHIAMRPLHESAPTSVFEETPPTLLATLDVGSPRSEEAQESDAFKEGKRTEEQIQRESSSPRKGLSKENGTGDAQEKPLVQSDGASSEEKRENKSQEPAIEKLKSMDATKPDTPMTMRDFLSYMNDRTALVRQVRKESNGNGGGDCDNLMRSQSYSEGRMLQSRGPIGSQTRSGQGRARKDSLQRHPGQNFAKAMGLKRPGHQEGKKRDKAVVHPLQLCMGQQSTMKRSQTFSA